MPPGRRRRKRTAKRRGLRPVLATVLVASALLVGVAGVVAVSVARSALDGFWSSCDLATESVNPLGETSFVYAANGLYLGAIHHDYYRHRVSLDEVSPWVRQATLAIEDRRFYDHPGVDPQGVFRAAVRNLSAGEIREGGSTLTQQVVRNLYLTKERSWERKQKEACLALKLEQEWPKERILGTYLNRAYYGHRAFGIEAAAQTYFGRKAKDLGPAQAALLAGLPQAPTQYDPLSNPKAAKQRRNDVLAAMRQVGAIPLDAYEKLVELPLNLRPGYLYKIRRAPYFFQYVRQQLVDAYGEQSVRRGGFRVHTTLDPKAQNAAGQAIKQNLDLAGDPASAVVSVDPFDGAIRALTQVVPGRAPDFNLAFQGSRQAGSAFKTFVLAEAMRQGMHPDRTSYDSAPFSYVPGPGQKPWEPKTYSGSYYGPSTVTQATLRSDNVVYARLTVDVGPANVARLAERMGIRSGLLPVPSIGLGTNDVSVLDMASAYATLAASGVHREPFAIRKVVLPSGEEDTETWGPGGQARALPETVAYATTLILEANMQRGTGTAAQIAWPAAGKTGTTDDHTDAWFAGYTRQLATAVWVGYPNKAVQMTNVHGIRVAGGTFPAMIWGDYMAEAMKGKPQKAWKYPSGSWEWKQWSGRHSASSRPGDRPRDWEG
jgi:penicillin-binding protein 1A